MIFVKGYKLVSNSFVGKSGIIRTDLILRLNGQVLNNTLYFQANFPIAVGDFNIFADLLIDWWTTYIRPFMPPEVTLEVVRVTDMATPTGLSVQYTTGLPIAGSSVNTPMPGNVTQAVKFTTEKRGKSFTGRNFVPCVPKEVVTGATVGSDFTGVMKAAYEALLPAALAGDAVWVIASKVAAGVLRTVLETTPVIGVSVDPTIDSQRRRLPGRGR